MTHKHRFSRIVPHKKPPRAPPDMTLSDSTEHQTSHIAQVDGSHLCEATQGSSNHKSQVRFMEQVLDWVKHERQHQRERALKREVRKAEKKGRASQHPPGLQEQIKKPTDTGEIPIPGRVDTDENLAGSVITSSPESTTSEFGASTESLNRLEMIARAGLAASTSSRVDVPTTATPPKGTLSHRPSRKTLHPHSRSVSYGSDTDYTSEGDVLVPECEVTLGTPEEIGWDNFKEEILKLTHTLRCKGWRKVALERYKELEVQRLSGALTNAVYVVFPPQLGEVNRETSTVGLTPKRRPV